MSVRKPRIACVQLNPITGQVSKNVAKVKELVKDLEPGSMDALVLPEMALTGYIFSSIAEIEHLLEDPYDEQESSSPSFQLAKELAIRLHCYVVVGFPMRVNRTSSQPSSNIVHYDARLPNLIAEGVVEGAPTCYNAALLVDAQGQLVHVFSKHFSYENDKTWAGEGFGFQSLHLPKLGKVCVAICMDLNPYDFRAPFESYELANYCQREEVDILIMPMAWLLSELNDKDEADADTMTEGPDGKTINYWALRLSPLFEDEQQSRKDFYFVSCNRTGTEKTSKFAGSSSAVQISQEHKKGVDGPPIALIGAMGRQEGVQLFSF